MDEVSDHKKNTGLYVWEGAQEVVLKREREKEKQMTRKEEKSECTNCLQFEERWCGNGLYMGRCLGDGSEEGE